MGMQEVMSGPPCSTHANTLTLLALVHALVGGHARPPSAPTQTFSSCTKPRWWQHVKEHGEPPKKQAGGGATGSANPLGSAHASAPAAQPTAAAPQAIPPPPPAVEPRGRVIPPPARPPIMHLQLPQQMHPMTMGFQLFADMYQQQSAVLQQMMAMQSRLVENVCHGRPPQPPQHAAHVQAEPEEEAAEVAVAVAEEDEDEESDESEESEQDSSSSEEAEEEADSSEEEEGLRIATY